MMSFTLLRALSSKLMLPPQQIALLDSHEKWDGAGFVDSVLLFIDLFLGDMPGVPEKIAKWQAVLDSLPEHD